MKLGPAGHLAKLFINSRLTPLIVFASILLGVGATIILPREEEPQIKVPMVDIFVEMPGASPKEVEERVSRPMEKLLLEIPGVEYVYSTSRPQSSLVVVRFRVGEDEEKSIVKLNQKLLSNYDIIPQGASQPLVKPRSIDDVPILALTFWSEVYDHYTLRRVAAQTADSVKEIPDVSEVRIIGGPKREVRVELDTGKLAAHNIAPATLVPLLKKSNQQEYLGSYSSQAKEVFVETDGFFRNSKELGSLVIGVFQNTPVYLRDVSTIEDGPEEPENYVFFAKGPAAHEKKIPGTNQVGSLSPAVTLAISKRQGTNAITVAEQVLKKIKTLKGSFIPSDIHITTTRHYGETAKEKSNELLFHMAVAIFSVTLLIMAVLGLRESGIVAIAIPVTLALTLIVFYLYGYTLNRITLFALIFSIGILVDDAIVVVENIVRHQHLAENKGRSLASIAVEAVGEVGNPTILATIAVIAAILPMAFVRGLMGPYMRPIPVGATAAMGFSLIVAFIVTPWASIRLLKPYVSTKHTGEKENWSTKLYRRVMTPLIQQKKSRTFFLIAVLLMLFCAVALVPLKLVKVKMLPFDNKSEFQVVVDMPEDTPLETTASVLQGLGNYLAEVDEVTDYQLYSGTASPYNFNGLVRHYFLRQEPYLGDIQVNLAAKHSRKRQSHDIVKSIRPNLEAIGKRYGATVQIAEVPPGPPVLQTLVAEVYGQNAEHRLDLARKIKEVFESTPGVVDVDWYRESEVNKIRLEVDKEKARLSGVDMEQINITLKLAVSGLKAGLIHIEEEKEDLPIVLRLPREKQTASDFLTIHLIGDRGSRVPLGEIVQQEESPLETSIYRKNGMPVIYITGDVSGDEESPVYAILKMSEKIKEFKDEQGIPVKQFTTSLPYFEITSAMKWDGEWHISYEVFRDLGLAFGAVLILIYILVVGWFQSFRVPLVIMAAIPFSLVGILPAHWAMGAFFTATSMIGFIAGAGIVVRNSIILVDFIELRLAENMPLAEAVIDAGAVRFRPMMLTAAAVVVGAGVILFDPIFQGLAISLMAGEIASLFLSRMTVPVLYYLLKKREFQ
jgi:multidrug efflux pump subunit AcrB